MPLMITRKVVLLNYKFNDGNKAENGSRDPGLQWMIALGEGEERF
jgi:hypothetical protein